MGDSLHSSGLIKNSEMSSVPTEKKASRRYVVASGPKVFSQNTVRNITSLSHGIPGSGAAGHVALFLLKVAALETVRRFSRAKCPFAWRGLQALQVLCYPPFKWIQKWAPFRGLVKGMQTLSRPLLVLSIASSFSDQTEASNETSDDIGPHASSDVHPELSSVQSTLDTSICDDTPPSLPSENWLIQLHKELENQGVSLPERINEDELHRFFTAANGDFSCLLSSIKKTIRWRETYRIFSEQELEMWSDLVFWHGYDMKNQPFLVVRLGLACSSLPFCDRPRFTQAVISQVEHGVLHLVDAQNPQISVLMDCEGLSPFRFPMQMMRSCSSLLQDNFPNRLGYLFVIRLPSVVRVVAQTFVQVLKPITRKKLKIEGEAYQKVLSEHIRTLPSYLGGKCTCTKCSNISMRLSNRNAINLRESSADVSDDENLPLHHSTHETGIHLNGNCDQILRTAVVGILMLWVLFALIEGIFNPESRLF